jgi:membrane fusion protein, peptide pheromone/bacteriocin exporter
MSKQIFPAAIVENSQESNFSRHNVRLRVLNWVILALVIICIITLPFIEVEVGLRGQGMIRPVTEFVQITSPVSGNLKEFRASENLPVNKGEPIAIIEAPQIDEQLRYINRLITELNTYQNDLHYLLTLDLNQLTIQPELQSEKYHHSFLQFHHNQINLKQEMNHHERELSRQTVLRERELSSRVQFEEAEFYYQQAQTNYKLAIEQQRNRWKAELLEVRLELEENQYQLTQLKQELELYTIRSPVTGTIQNLAPVQQQSFIHLNQVLGEITPDTSLVAAVFVAPKDIGLLSTGMPVKLNIDAYNHNEWGTLDGSVIDISGDILVVDQQPVYRVLCAISQTYLTLSNGYRGELKKGMSFQARFIITERSLFQLLFDNIDDWLNPFWNSDQQYESIAGQ